MFLLQALVFVLVLGMIIVWHELGHFLAARRQGIRVEEFSVGFGKPIVTRQRGGIRYSWRWIPLGGYVKFVGGELMLGRDRIAEKELREREIDPDDPDLLVNRPALQRFWVMAAGPVMNLALAFLLAPLVFLIGIEEPAVLDAPPRIVSVDEDSPARQAGFQPGQRIVAIDGRPQPNWKSVLETILLAPNQTLTVTLHDGETERTVSVPIREDPGTHAGYLGINPSAPPPNTIGEVQPGLPAHAAGLRAGDRIEAVAGRPTPDWLVMAREIRRHPEIPVELSVRRGAESFSVRLTPAVNPQWTERAGMIGIGPVLHPEPMALKRYGLAEAVRQGTDRALHDWFFMMFRVLHRLVTGEISVKTMSGPVGIASLVGAQVESGVERGDAWRALAMIFNLMGLLSMNIGLLNLLPFPPLDGSHIAMLGYEKIRGRALPGIWLERMIKVGFAALITLILFITYNDVLRLWGDSLRGLFAR